MRVERECETCEDEFTTDALSPESECHGCRLGFEELEEILVEYTDNDKTALMLCLVRDETRAAVLDYEEWVTPLKLDDRIALFLRHPDWKGPEYVYHDGDGFRMWPLGIKKYTGETSEESLRGDIEDGEIEVLPALRENTPLSEDSE